MRTYLSYIIFGVALLASCNNEDLQVTPSKETLEVANTFQMDANNESYSFSVKANCQWTVELLSGWEDLQLRTRSGSGDGNVSLVTTKNDAPTTREAFLLITSQTGVVWRKIQVFQSGTEPYIYLNQSGVKQITLDASFRKSTYEVTLMSNSKWEVTGGADGFTCETPEGTGNATIRFTVKENELETVKDAEFSISPVDKIPHPNAVATVKIHQAARTIDISVNPGEHQVSAEGETFAVRVSSTDKWQVVADRADFTCNVAGGEGDSTVYITIPENLYDQTQKGVFTFQTVGTSRTATATLTVNQDARVIEISVNPTEITVEAEGESRDVAVTCTDSWQVIGSAKGFNVDMREGIQNGKVRVTVDENMSEDPRECEFTFQIVNTTNNKMTTLKVMQKGKIVELNVPTTQVTAAAIGGITNSIQVLCNADWTASINQSWAHLESSTGSGNGYVNVVCDQNTSTTVRTATLVIEAGRTAQPRTVTITQQPGATPTVVQTIVSDVTKYEATVAFSYQSSTSVVSEYGVCYATHETPTINDLKKTERGNDTGNDVSVKLENLESGTTYYVRPYARNATGITYGEQKSFTTKGSMPGEDDNIDPKL